ncbi:MAG: tetratricopeptide repeat protein [bacterium]
MYEPMWQYAIAGIVVVVLFWAMIYIARSRRRKDVGPRQAYVDALKSLLDGDMKEGARKLKEAVSQDTDNVDAYIRLGDLLRRSGHAGKALQIHISLLGRRNLARPAYTRVKESLYEDYKYLGELSKATDILKELVYSHPEGRSFRKKLLWIYEKRGMWEEAVDTKRMLVDSGTDEGRRKLATYQANVGITLRKGGREEEALRHLRSALKLYKDCAPALISLGDASYSRGDAREAISYWRKVVKGSPAYAFLTLERMEKALFDQGKFGEIKVLYEEFLSRNQANVFVRDALARIYLKMGETESAVSEYEKALEIAPDHLPARIGLARLYVLAERSEDALNELLPVVEAVSRERKRYCCTSCGHTSEEFEWVCPRCGETESFAI